jgi:pyruvate kinase
MRKKTKIVATISDRNCDVPFLESLYKEGMDVVRLNTAHQSHEDSLKVIRNVRQVSDKIALLLDTKGPEIRTTRAEEDFPVKAGDQVCIKGDPDQVTTRECIGVTYPGFSEEVTIGSTILIDDGYIELKAIRKDGDRLRCEVMNDGLIQGRKSVNIPSVHVKLPTLSQKDRDYIYFAIEHDLDFIAHSFVRRKEDLMAIQNILDEKQSKIKLIAKIENQEGVDNIDEILEHCYGIMVARGDLAVEIPQEQIPAVQKMLIQKCISLRKPVITATQMLHSMIQNPRPTRAEVSDVANAIYDGTDAIMLSGETAYGKFPLKAVQTMKQIANQVEKTVVPFRDIPYLELNNEVTAFLINSAVKASVMLHAEAIVADTISGRTIRALSAYRGKKIIFAQCYDKRVMRELALSYGVMANFLELRKTNDEFINNALKVLMGRKRVDLNSLVVVIAGNYGSSHGASFIEVSTVENILKKCQNSILNQLN